MARMARSCLQALLKLVNSVVGLVGTGMIVYSLWMIRAWYKQTGTYPWSQGAYANPPWFIYSFLGIGVILCLITCCGHIGAETTYGHCLSCYILLMFLLIVMEVAITTDMFLNKHWEEDFPDDPTGRFHEFKDFVKSNLDICRWIGVVVVVAQALSIFLAMILRALGPDREVYCDSDDEYIPARLPLLVNPVQPPAYVVSDPRMVQKNDSWNLRINER